MGILHLANPLGTSPGRAEASYAAIRRDGSAEAMLSEKQTRAELYGLIGLHAFKTLDVSIVASIVPGNRR